MTTTKDITDIITSMTDPAKMRNEIDNIRKNNHEGSINTLYEYQSYSYTIDYFIKIMDLYNKSNNKIKLSVQYELSPPLLIDNDLKNLGYFKIKNESEDILSTSELEKKGIFFTGLKSLYYTNGKGKSYCFEYLLLQNKILILISLHLNNVYYYFTLKIIDDNRTHLVVYQKQNNDSKILANISLDENMVTGDDIQSSIDYITLHLLYKINDDTEDFISQKTVTFKEKCEFLEIMNI